jgi:hypothetical protein
MKAIQSHFAAVRAEAEKQYETAQAAIQKHYQKQCKAALETLAAKHDKKLAALSTAEEMLLEKDVEQLGPSKIKIVRNALNGEYKRIRQLVEETGLTGDDVSRALSQKSLSAIMDKQGKPGSYEYRLKRRQPPPRNGTTSAILAVLEKNGGGIDKANLVDQVEKLTPSRTKHLRTAIRATLKALEERGRVQIDAQGVVRSITREFSAIA